MSRIYLLTEGFKKHSIRLSFHDKYINAGDLFFGRIPKEQIIQCSVYSGTKEYSLLPTTYSFLNVISEEIKEMLVLNKITGWDVYNLSLDNSEKQLLNSYFAFSVTGKCGQIKNERSVKTLMPPKIPNAPRYYARLGLYFDESSWDGSDFFSPEGSYYTFVNQKIKDLFEKYKVNNVLFKDITEVENLDIPYEFIPK